MLIARPPYMHVTCQDHCADTGIQFRISTCIGVQYSAGCTTLHHIRVSYISCAVSVHDANIMIVALHLLQGFACYASDA